MSNLVRYLCSLKVGQHVFLVVLKDFCCFLRQGQYRLNSWGLRPQTPNWSAFGLHGPHDPPKWVPGPAKLVWSYALFIPDIFETWTSDGANLDL